MKGRYSAVFSGLIVFSTVAGFVAFSGCNQANQDTDGDSQRRAPYAEERQLVEQPERQPEPRESRSSRGNLLVVSEAETDERQLTEGDFIGRHPADDVKSGCVGYIDDEPSFHFQVVGSQPVETTVRLNSSAGLDTTLLITGPSGTYCADDGAGELRPQLTETLPPGTYTVYVGAYQQNQGAYYEAEVLRTRPPFAVSECDASQTIEIGPGFRRQQISGEIERVTRECSSAFGMECTGTFPAQAGRCIEVSDTQPVRFRVTSAPFDSVMVLQSEDMTQTLFDDDSGGNRNSEIVTVLQPGTYALHIGGYGADARGPWSADVRPVDVDVSEDGTLTPRPAEECRELAVGETVTYIGTARPEISCSMMFPERQCAGAVPTQASHCLEMTGAASVRATITEGGFDSIMVISGEDVFLHNDDANDGLLSEIISPLPSGRYQILVGALSANDGGPYRLEITAERGAEE